MILSRIEEKPRNSVAMRLPLQEPTTSHFPRTSAKSRCAQDQQKARKTQVRQHAYMSALDATPCLAVSPRTVSIFLHSAPTTRGVSGVYIHVCACKRACKLLHVMSFHGEPTSLLHTERERESEREREGGVRRFELSRVESNDRSRETIEETDMHSRPVGHYICIPL